MVPVFAEPIVPFSVISPVTCGLVIDIWDPVVLIVLLAACVNPPVPTLIVTPVLAELLSAEVIELTVVAPVPELAIVMSPEVVVLIVAVAD